jgi:multiple sugar transport system ATP-binding protein
MSTLQLQSLTKSFGDVSVIKGVDLDVAHGQFVVFVGPSGCGKSTLLRMIAGLETASTGRILIDNAVVNDVSAAQRGCAMVFQSYALYPHMSGCSRKSHGCGNAAAPNRTLGSQAHAAIGRSAPKGGDWSRHRA